MTVPIAQKRCECCDIPLPQGFRGYMCKKCVDAVVEENKQRLKEEKKTAAKPIAKFKAKYLGGHGAFPKPKGVQILTYRDHFEVSELRLSLEYSRLKNVQSMTEERLKASRLFLVGLFAFAWKKRKEYLVITFTNRIGVEQNPVFDVDNISALQRFLYQQMVKVKTLKPATPETVSQPVASEDPMEKLAKLKKMVEAGLITEEDYNTKKAEILSKM